MDRPAVLVPPAGVQVGVALLILLTAVGLELRLGTAAALAAGGILGFGLVCCFHLETAFALILAVTPFSHQVVFRGLGSALQVPTEPMLFMALGVWILRSLARGNTRVSQPLFVGALALALLSCLASIVGTDYRFNAMKATLNATWYALFGIFVLNNFADVPRLRRLVVAWLLPSLLLVCWSVGHVASGHFYKWAGYYWGEPFFYDHGTFSAYLSFGTALAAAMALETSGWRRIMYAGLALATGAQVVLSMTRGAWLGLVGLALFFAIVYGRRLLRGGNLALMLLSAIAVLALMARTGTMSDVERHSSTITQVNYQSNFERLNRWYAGLRMFQKSPVTGAGYGTYQDYYSANRRYVLATGQSAQRMGIHSEYLRVVAETGLLGTAAAALSFVVLVLITRRVLVRTRPDPWLHGLTAGMAGGLVTYMVHAIVNNYLEFDKAAVPVWTAIGIIAAVDRLERPDS